MTKVRIMNGGKAMTHLGTKEIETARLLLRRFKIEDAEVMYRNWASDDEVTKYLVWPTHADVSVTKAVLTDWISQYEKVDFYNWAIVLKENGEPIGSIGGVDGSSTLNMVHIGYCIGRKWWHQGITSEAMKAVMDFLFDEVGMNRVESRHDPRNPNSGAVMRKCGMKYEGTLRQADRNNQGICDASYYGMLASER